MSDSEAETTPDVAIVIPIMDRASDLKLTLPALCSQDYPAYHIYFVIGGDELIPPPPPSAPPITILRIPRPRNFSFSMSRNIGVRSSSSEFLMFMDADLRFQHESVISNAISKVIKGVDADYHWFASWRDHVRRPPIRVRHSGPVGGRFSPVYAHSHGSIILVERDVFERLGGYNEDLRDWGYEDTDLIARLESVGWGRVPMQGIEQLDHDERLRTANFRVRDRPFTWNRNRIISDMILRANGPFLGRPRSCLIPVEASTISPAAGPREIAGSNGLEMSGPRHTPALLASLIRASAALKRRLIRPLTGTIGAFLRRLQQ